MTSKWLYAKNVPLQKLVVRNIEKISTFQIVRNGFYGVTCSHGIEKKIENENNS